MSADRTAREVLGGILTIQIENEIVTDLLSDLQERLSDIQATHGYNQQYSKALANVRAVLTEYFK